MKFQGWKSRKNSAFPAEKYKKIFLITIIQPTCVYYTVGSYASLSVCIMSVGLSLDNNSYLRKYYRYESETLPQDKAFIGALKNIPTTLSEIYILVNEH